MDILMPRNCDSILPATAKPAASSDALFTRKPDESRSIACSILVVALTALARAFKAPTFVLIEVIIPPFD
jgi:hypothetical protein